jgi:murein DD-endopeptidase MepM/ murein hydrolase activator NlpD
MKTRLPFRLRMTAFAALCLVAACSAPSQDSASTATPAMTKVVVVATTQSPPATPAPISTTIIERYTIRAGDTLSGISQRFDVSVDELMRVNGLADPHALKIGQALKVPIQVTRAAPADFLLPDSEVVYSPAYATFDAAAFASQYNGYLAGYREKVEGEFLTGAQIVQLVAERFSVGPRALLALLEFQSGWVTKTALTENQITYPMGLNDPSRKGLFLQLGWAANHLNEGYYAKLSGQFAALKFKDRSRARLAPTINAGSAAIQNALALTATWDEWQNEIGARGFIATYRKLFGDPNARAIEPLVPKDLKQPMLRLPWNDGETWYYTGGPHSGWGDLAAWAAVDFSPRDVLGSCNASRLWAIAAAPGKVVRVERGRVMINVSGNNFQGDGWTLMYLHVASAGRVAAGARVNAGDRIGHPSCEGGTSESSHIHFARLYNGQWISPETVPLILSDWRITSLEQEYDGMMSRGAETREACNCRDDLKNAIIADAGTKQ